MEAIDAFSNSDLLWLLLGYRATVKAGAFACAFVCYHAFAALRERRVAALIHATAARVSDAASAAVRVARRASFVARPWTRGGAVDDDPGNGRGASAAGAAAAAPATADAPAAAVRPGTCADDDSVDAVRRVNLGLAPLDLAATPTSSEAAPAATAPATAAAAPQAGSGFAAPPSPAAPLIDDFPLLTAQRSLTALLDYLAPGQLLTEALALVVESAALWALSQHVLGPIEPGGALARVAASAPAVTATVAGDAGVAAAASSSSWMWTATRWAQRFVAGPPAALGRVFGEDASGRRMQAPYVSLVARSLLGAITFRDAMGIDAIPLLPRWVGCLVTPMSVRFRFVGSDLRDNMTMADVRAIASANAVRALSHSLAAMAQTTVVTLLRLRRERANERAIVALSAEVDARRRGPATGAADALSLPASEQQQQQQQQRVLPLLQGLLADTSVRAQLLAAASNAASAFVGDLVGLAAVLALRRIVRPTSLLAQCAITAARLACSAAVLTTVRFFASRLRGGSAVPALAATVVGPAAVGAQAAAATARAATSTSSALSSATPVRDSAIGTRLAALARPDDAASGGDGNAEGEATSSLNPLRRTMQQRVGRSSAPAVTAATTATAAAAGGATPTTAASRSVAPPASLSPALVAVSPALGPTPAQSPRTDTNFRSVNFPADVPAPTAATASPAAPDAASASSWSRARLLDDLDAAFGDVSALALSHASEATHSMLSSLAPDNNVRLHALMYLSAVDTYVAAVNHGELPRRFIMQAPAGGADASRGGATATYNLTLNRHVHLPQHTFTAEEIADRKALIAQQQQQQQLSSSASSGGAIAGGGAAAGGGGGGGGGAQHPHRPFYCVACKYTFRAGHRALVLPCGHLTHDSCATRLRADWCPRCCRPFEKPASSERTVRELHSAAARVTALEARWQRNVLLPPHLWFTEWRRVRQYVTHESVVDRQAKELCALRRELEARDAAEVDGGGAAAGGPLPPASARTSSVGFVAAPESRDVSTSTFVHDSAASFTVESAAGLPPRIALPTSQRRGADALSPLTWRQALVDSHTIFAVPDDFSPSAYGVTDVPIMAALAALGVLTVNRAHERTLAMVHESLVDGATGSSSSTSQSRVTLTPSISSVKC
jgi:hypothetical protein